MKRYFKVFLAIPIVTIVLAIVLFKRDELKAIPFMLTDSN
jgi:hypothetical protein